MDEQRLRIAATAANGAEADLIRQRLSEAGIESVSQRTIGGPEWGFSGAEYVYVDPRDLERARELLRGSADLSEAELGELAEDAGPPPPD
ncbi:MAG TPA: hypothetical protein VHY83_06475 [Solirubrobacteraceae bacterium]|jgi:hypothetical protein|nr:hypothetical protein [Solirubrobacteraceae bacterium]